LLTPSLGGTFAKRERMNILLIGSGGREHALAWKIAASPLVERIFCAPGNAGIAQEATCVALNAADHAAVITFCREHKIGLVVIGPEAPLVAGLVDDLTAAGIKAFGPTAAAARLEGSKGFTKDLCRDHNIPTAAYARFSEAGPAKDYASAHGGPLVVKADGLAFGKGVILCDTVTEVHDAIDKIMSGVLSEDSTDLVIEEFLRGEEASFFAISDGVNALPLATAQDHKRVFDGDRGPNTGGMGAYSPAPVMTPEMCARTMDEIVMPTIRAMNSMGCPFKGVLYAGLMITDSGPKLIEYNVRFGDPECQALMLRLKSDLVPAMLAASDGVLKDFDLRWSDDASLCVVMAANGYPGDYDKGSVIEGIDKAQEIDGVEIFHAATNLADGKVLANGGRVLGIPALGTNVTDAQARAYEAVDSIKWPGGFCRRDIGWQAVAREKSKA